MVAGTKFITIIWVLILITWYVPTSRGDRRSDCEVHRGYACIKIVK